MALPKLITLSILLSLSLIGFAQGRPDQLPQDFVASGTDEIYMQNPNEGSANPQPRRQSYEVARSYFAASVAPINAVPSPTGNTQRNVIGTAIDGNVYFIDHLGRSVRLDPQAGGVRVTFQVGVNLTPGTNTVTLPFTPSRDEQLRIYRNPCYYRIGGSVTRSSSTLTFTDYPFETNETITVHFHP